MEAHGQQVKVSQLASGDALCGLLLLQNCGLVSFSLSAESICNDAMWDTGASHQ